MKNCSTQSTPEKGKRLPDSGRRENLHLMNYLLSLPFAADAQSFAPLLLLLSNFKRDSRQPKLRAENSSTSPDLTRDQLSFRGIQNSYSHSSHTRKRPCVLQVTSSEHPDKHWQRESDYESINTRHLRRKQQAESLFRKQTPHDIDMSMTVQPFVCGRQIFNG